MKEITGKTLNFYKGDVRDHPLLAKIFKEHKIDAAIHFAGLKAVDESYQMPLAYYDNNLSTTLALYQEMDLAGFKNLVFSSSVTVYGASEKPIQAEVAWAVVLLCYFNPVGSHKSGRIGEDPKDIPNNLMPFISKVVVGRGEKLSVFSNDNDTIDGSGVRDYIHVVDLDKGHVCTAQNLLSNKAIKGVEADNLGSGTGTSVLEWARISSSG